MDQTLFGYLKPNIKETKIVKLANKGESAKAVKIGALILGELKTRPKQLLHKS
jgi:hypothetical protein